jgi:hypothetical protein
MVKRKGDMEVLHLCAHDVKNVTLDSAMLFVRNAIGRGTLGKTAGF